MTSRLRIRPATGPLLARPVDGVLLRLRCTGPDWASGIPPAPQTNDQTAVSVSFSATQAALAHADALEALGYRIAGIQPLSCLCVPGSSTCWPGHAQSLGVDLADFFATRTNIPPDDPWWQTMRGCSHRVFQLGFGPALEMLADTLALHLSV